MSRILLIATCLLLLLTTMTAFMEKNEGQIGIEPQHQESTIIRDTSELSKLMLNMFSEAQQVKLQIANEAPLTLSLNHEEILTAEATQPERTTTEKYQTFATQYLQTVADLRAAEPAQRADSYRLMVNSCVKCHEAICPGPLSRIEKLR